VSDLLNSTFQEGRHKLLQGRIGHHEHAPFHPYSSSLSMMIECSFVRVTENVGRTCFDSVCQVKYESGHINHTIVFNGKGSLHQKLSPP
jgi:hypothetical protein